MKTKFWLAAAMLAASLYTTAASAEMVVGFKGGAVDYDRAGSDPSINGSLQLAFDIFDIGVADFAIEGEHSRSFTDGELDFGFGNADTSLETTALYLAMRTAGPVYLIARVGMARMDLEFEGVGTIDDDGIASGLGLGFSAGLRMEIEYTQYEAELGSGLGDLDIKYLTLGFGF
jgi:outer membrane immunogenic protein